MERQVVRLGDYFNKYDNRRDGEIQDHHGSDYGPEDDQNPDGPVESGEGNISTSVIRDHATGSREGHPDGSRDGAENDDDDKDDPNRQLIYRD